MDFQINEDFTCFLTHLSVLCNSQIKHYSAVNLKMYVLKYNYFDVDKHRLLKHKWSTL